jgi:hypothetical protein
MIKKISKGYILKKNPHINTIILSDSIKLSELLKANGAKMAGYNLSSPFSRGRLKKSGGDFTCTKGGYQYHRI